MTLTESQCNEIISWHSINGLENVRAFAPGGLAKSTLDYNICEVWRSDTTQWFFDLVHEHIKPQYPNNKINEGNFFYLHRWDEGHKFEKHIDKKRDCSWALVYGATLNEGFDGGKLIAYNPEEELGVKKGEIYIMDSTRLHEVTEITKGVRYSFVYFISNEFLGIPKSII